MTIITTDMAAPDPQSPPSPPSADAPAPRNWARRIGWLLLIWTLSVAALGVAAYGLRLVMRAIGMST